MAHYESPHCVSDGDVTIGEDVGIWHYAVVRGDEAAIRIGDRSNIQDGCILHVDEGTALTIGNGVTVGHRAVVHGCTIDDDVLIGMGAIVLNGAHVGAGSIIAAGAVVLGGAEIPPNSMVMGVPAKVRGTIRPEQIKASRENAERYVALAKKHLKEV